ncbi:MAG: cob(I)yrinic acid a,c-diamide adenosyltransferase [bacterium]|nr:cob(I)yrinic acid a,c-diamide adenosyltransferase [bacterium]
MSLFTGKGDGGTTKFFDTPKGARVSKASCRTECLGASDELNSFLGLCKVHSDATRYTLHAVRVSHIVEQVQQSLFIIQAEMAGAEKTIAEEKVRNMEKLINLIEAEMPPIKTFFISGGTELASLFDISRTLARRMERRVVEAVEKKEVKVGEQTLAYINRLSSLLYALARYANFKAGIKESPPSYK